MTATGPYQVMPPLSTDEYEALKADIAEHGVLVPIVRDQHGNTIDGHHRSLIADEMGIKYRIDVIRVADEGQARTIARQLNLSRRHLNRQQKRQLIADEINANSDRSDREISRLMGCDHKTVASVRRELGGELPHPKLDAVPSEEDLGMMLIWLIGQKYAAAETDDAKHSWARGLQLCETIANWMAGTPNILTFCAFARQLYEVDLDHEMWSLLAPWLVAVANCAIGECSDKREATGDSAWRGPGEDLAEITIALWSRGVGRDIRNTMYGAMGDKIAAGLADIDGWWPAARAEEVGVR